MTVSIRSRTSGRDPVARIHRRTATFRIILLICAMLALIGGSVWLMFASSVFAVTEVRVTDAPDTVAEDLQKAVNEVLGQRRLGFLRPSRNILLLDTNAVATSLLATFSNLERLDVVKEYPHAVSIAVTLRSPRGVWCMGESCQYFDTSGARWGTALPSRGPLLLLVRDERTDAQWDQRLFEGMTRAVDGLPELGLRPISVTFPDAAPGDVRVNVAAGYDVILDAMGDVADQLATLGVLVADGATDPAFHPLYIDVRTPGRAYYK